MINYGYSDSDINLIKVSSTGQIISDNSFGGDYDDMAVGLTIDLSGNVYILGKSNSGISKNKTAGRLSNAGPHDHDYWLIKLNSSGVKLWDKTFSYKIDYGWYFYWRNDPLGILLTSDNKLIMYGDSYHPSGGVQNCALIKVDNNGNEIWNKYYASADFSGGDPSTNAKKIIEVGNSYYFLGSVSQYLWSTNTTYNGYRIYKIDNSGNVVWQTEKPGTANDIIEYNGNLFCASGFLKGTVSNEYGGNNSLFDYSVSAFDLNGNKVSEMVLKAQKSQVPSSIIINSGKIVIGGSSSSGISIDKSEASKGGSDWWIVKLNTELCSSTAILKGLIVTTENNKSFDARWSNNLLNVGSYQWRYKKTTETNWSATRNSPQFFGVQNIPSDQTYHYQVKAVCLNGQQTAWSTSPSIYLRNQVPVIDYPPTVTTNHLSPGGNIQVKGSKFTPNGNVTLEVRGISGFGQDYNFSADASGVFTQLVYVTSVMQSGKYTIKGIDYGVSSGARIAATTSITGTPANKVLEFNVNLTSNIPTITIPFAKFDESNTYVNFFWRDFISVLPPYATYLNSQQQRQVRYKIELGREVSSGNISWLQTQPTVDKYVKSGESKLFYEQITPTLALSAGKYVIRVTDLIKQSNNLISVPFDFVPITTSITVEKNWDFTYPENRSGKIFSVAADGISRFYLKTKIGNSTVTKVKVELMDENNSSAPPSTLLGKLKVATNTTSWSDEANDASQKSIFVNSKIGDSFWCWYVAPDNFADGNLTTPSTYSYKSQRTVKVKITGLSASNVEVVSKIEEINIVRPPLYLVHGLGGEGGFSGTWDDFKFEDNSGNKKLFVQNQGGYFARVIAPHMEGNSKHDVNANILLADRNSNLGIGRSFQWNIEEMRKSGILATSFDYVAHSMGGCMLRAAIDDAAQVKRFYTNKNYGKGYVHKFITLTTPHNGSPLGDIVSDVAKDEYFTGDVVRGLINKIGGELTTFFDIKKVGDNYVINGPSDAVKDFSMANQSGGRKFGIVTKTKSHVIVSDYVEPNTRRAATEAIFALNSNLEELSLKASDTKTALNMLGGLVKRAAKEKAFKERNFEVSREIDLIDGVVGTIGVEVLNTSSETSAFMSYYAGYLVPVMVDFLHESDLIVPIISQLASLPLEAPNVTQNKNSSLPNYLKFKANHNFLPDKICDNDIVGNRVFQLLNADVNSPLFGDLNASPFYSAGATSTIAKDDETQKINNVYAVNEPLIESRRIFSKVRIDAPLGIEIIPFGTEKPISTYISDTTKLVSAKVIIGNEIIALPKTNANTLNYLFDNIGLGNQKIYLEAVYSYGLDSLITYWDSVTVNVNSNLTPQTLVLNQQDLYIFKGDTLSLNLGLKYSTFAGSINSSSIDVGLLSSNTSKVIIASGSKNVIALDTGYVMLTYTYKGLSINQFVTVLNKQLLCKDNPTKITHSGNVLSGEYSALETLESSVNVPDDIYYYAGKAIVLKPGFSVGINETFLAEIRKCDDLETISTEGLVAYYPFDGNANDASGNGNNLTAVGTNSFVADRKNETLKAISYGGNSSVGYSSTANSQSLQFSTGFTISIWYKLGSYAGMDGWRQQNANGYQILAAKEGDRGGFYIGVSNDVPNNKQAINFTNNPSSGVNNFNITANPDGNSTQNLNKWNHFVGTVSNGTVKIYINGVLKNSTNVAVNFTGMNSKPLFLGTMWALGTYWYPYSGAMDEVRVYNRALSESEVQGIYNSEKP
jgi:uncharacterized protein (UPF0147 family)